MEGSFFVKLDYSIVLFIYFVGINVWSGCLMGWDKHQARQGKRRTPENRLLCLAAAGGAAGMVLGMRRFRHKTRHNKFRYGLPFLMILNGVVYGFLFWLTRT